jgi:hypothetical protein
MDASFLRGDALGFLEGMQGLADLVAHGVGLGQVQVVAADDESGDDGAGGAPVPAG